MKTRKQWLMKPGMVFLLAIFATFLWGSAFPSIKVGYRLFQITSEDTGGQVLFAGARFLFAGLFVLLSYCIQEHKVCMPEKGQWRGILILGFVQTFLQYFFYYIGMAHVTGVKGSIMNASSTLMCVLAAHFYYRNDRLSIHKVIGCTVGFAGVILVNLSKGPMESGFQFLGEGFLLCCAVAAAASSLISKEVTQKTNPILAAGYQLVLGGLGLVIFGYAIGGRIHTVSWGAILLFLYMVFISAVAYSIWSVLLKYHPVGKISVYMFLVPVFGSLLSILILRESVWDIKIILALICVCLGIYFVNKEMK